MTIMIRPRTRSTESTRRRREGAGAGEAAWLCAAGARRVAISCGVEVAHKIAYIYRARQRDAASGPAASSGVAERDQGSGEPGRFVVMTITPFAPRMP